jgi:hypothetical protein
MPMGLGMEQLSAGRVASRILSNQVSLANCWTSKNFVSSSDWYKTKLLRLAEALLRSAHSFHSQIHTANRSNISKCCPTPSSQQGMMRLAVPLSLSEGALVMRSVVSLCGGVFVDIQDRQCKVPSHHSCQENPAGFAVQLSWGWEVDDARRPPDESVLRCPKDDEVGGCEVKARVRPCLIKGEYRVL